MNTLVDNVLATLDESVNVVGAHECKSRNRYQMFGLERLALTGQMEVQVHKSNVPVSVTDYAIVDGDQAVQELTWALFQAQQITINVLGPIAHD